MRVSKAIGKRFGRLVVDRFMYRDKRRNAYVLCRCDCGNKTIVQLSSLTSGDTTSCGCRRKEGGPLKHGACRGGKRLSEYQIWRSMTQRCYNPNNRAYKDYGGRGIKVCARWRHSFENFLADMGPRPTKHHTLERIDNNGDYSPENCCWATKKEQSNNRRDNLLLTFEGKTMTAKQWAEKIGMNYETLYRRIKKYGWPIEVALTTSIRGSA